MIKIKSTIKVIEQNAKLQDRFIKEYKINAVETMALLNQMTIAIKEQHNIIIGIVVVVSATFGFAVGLILLG